MITDLEKFAIKLNGQSMTPLLNDQDEILFQPSAFEQIKCGDIVLLWDRKSSELLVHRLIAFPLQTKGDYSLISENNSQDCYLGKAIGFKRGNTYRKFPDSQIVFLFFSKLRMKNFVIRKIGLLGLILSAIFFEFYSAKTKLDHI